MSTSSSLIRGVALVAALAVAFVAGRWTVLHPVQPMAGGKSANVLTEEVSGNLPRQDFSHKTLANALVESTRLRERVIRTTGSLSADDERQRLLDQWAEVDPRAALDFARTQMKGDPQAQAISSTLSIWGKNDPDAAWKWVETAMPEARHHFDNLLEVFGRKSTELAGRYASLYAIAHPEAATEVNLAALLGITYRGDFDGARALVERNAITNTEMRATLNNFVAGQWARYEPSKAVEWVMSLPAGPEREHALVGLGESWSERDPAGAASFAATLPESESRSLAMRQAIAKWVENEPLAARQWVIQSDARQDFDSAVEAIATQNNFMYREPAKAITWATGIFNDALRAKTMSTVLHNWYMTDSAAATAFLQTTSEFSSEQRSELLKQLQANH